MKSLRHMMHWPFLAPLRLACAAGLILVPLAVGTAARAQDIPGIEICTRESDMARRTGCLQSNIDYLQKLIARNAVTAQQKLDAANIEITALKAALAAVQASIAKLQAAPKADSPASKPDGK